MAASAPFSGLGWWRFRLWPVAFWRANRRLGAWIPHHQFEAMQQLMRNGINWRRKCGCTVVAQRRNPSFRLSNSLLGQRSDFFLFARVGRKLVDPLDCHNCAVNVKADRLRFP